MEGWIKLYKKFKKWEWFESSEMVHLFIYLLLSVNYEDKIWSGIKVKRGQIVTSRRKLSKKLGISEQRIRTCLSNLLITQEVTQKSTHRYTIITLVKYDKYQINTKNQPTKPPKTTQKSTTTKEDKEETEKKENTYDEKSSRQFLIKNMPINLEDLNDEDITYEEEEKQTPKKYKGRTKSYARIAIHYLTLKGEGGNVLRYYKDIKELWEIAEKEVKPEKVEAEIMARIDVYKKYADIEKISWGLGAVIKNWNAILNDYAKKVQL